MSWHAMGAGRPDLELLALDVSGSDVDITDHLREATIKFGRQEELGRVEAATCSLRMNNRDGLFDTRHSATLRPMRALKLRGRWPAGSGTVYPLFYGYADSLPRTRARKYESEVRLELVDGLAAIAGAEFDLDSPEQLTYERVGAILGQINWTPGFVDLDTGSASTMPAKLYENANALDAIRGCEAAEVGQFFAWLDGKPTFRGRHYRYTVQNTPQGEFGDVGSGAALPCRDLTPELGTSRLVNRASFTATGDTGGPQTIEDTVSQGLYFLHSESADLEVIDDATALEAARYKVSKYAYPFERVTAIELSPRMLPADLWPQVLGRKFGDQIRVREKPNYASGVGYEQRLHIEGWSHQLTNAKDGDGLRWVTTWQLSPAEIDTFWILGVPGYSELGQTTRLAF